MSRPHPGDCRLATLVALPPSLRSVAIEAQREHDRQHGPDIIVPRERNPMTNRITYPSTAYMVNNATLDQRVHALNDAAWTTREPLAPTEHKTPR